MMAAIEDLINQVADQGLRDKIRHELARLKSTKKFGLVFEEHVPELVKLPRLSPRPGSRVVKKEAEIAYRVISEADATTFLIAPETGGSTETVDRQSLVVVKAFGEPIFPALIPLDAVSRDANKPWHTIVNAENYHALQLLIYGYEGSIDVIYIDPPYNTGARDWKYNNDYVDKKDRYRHSKWLSMMKKRLLLAKRLLKPDGVLIVTIDEHEIYHLGVLLEDAFPESARQMVTIVINQKGVPQGGLARVEEYAMYAFMGRAAVQVNEDDLLTPHSGQADLKVEVEEEQEDEQEDDEIEVEEDEAVKIAAKVEKPRWERLLRGGSGSRRKDRAGQFYPVHVDPETKQITGIGDAIPLEDEPDLTKAAEGRIAWPIRSDLSYGRYQTSPETLRILLAEGYVKLGRFDKHRNTWTVLYLNESARERIEQGVVRIVGKHPITGAVELEYSGVEDRKRNIKTVWHRNTHDSVTVHGLPLPFRGW